jgi:hypothetical protein
MYEEHKSSTFYREDSLNGTQASKKQNDYDFKCRSFREGLISNHMLNILWSKLELITYLGNTAGNANIKEDSVLYTFNSIPSFSFRKFAGNITPYCPETYTARKLTSQY